MRLLLDSSAGASPVRAFGTVGHPDPVVVVPTQVPGLRAGYLPLPLDGLLRFVAAIIRRQRYKALLRELADRPDHVLVDAGVPLDAVRGAQAYVAKAATVTYTGR